MSLTWQNGSGGTINEAVGARYPGANASGGTTTSGRTYFAGFQQDAWNVYEDAGASITVISDSDFTGGKAYRFHWTHGSSPRSGQTGSRAEMVPNIGNISAGQTLWWAFEFKAQSGIPSADAILHQLKWQSVDNAPPLELEEGNGNGSFELRPSGGPGSENHSGGTVRRTSGGVNKIIIGYTISTSPSSALVTFIVDGTTILNSEPWSSNDPTSGGSGGTKYSNAGNDGYAKFGLYGPFASSGFDINHDMANMALYTTKSEAQAHWTNSGGGGGGGGGGTTAGESAAFTWSPSSPNTGDLVTFNGSASTGTSLTYSWDLDGATTLTGVSPTFTFQNVGTKSVTLTVTDNVGGTASVSHDIAVGSGSSNPAPVAAFTFSPSSPNTGDLVTFNASASTGTSLTYAWSLDDVTHLTGVSPTFTFQNPGTKAVTLTVTDSDNNTDDVEHDIVVGQGGSGTSSPIAKLPTGVTTSDLIFVHVGLSSPTATLTIPSGFTNLTTTPPTSGTDRSYLLVKRYNSGTDTADFTLTLTGTTGWTTASWYVRGADSTASDFGIANLGSQAVSSAATSFTPATITSTADDSRYYLLASAKSSSTTQSFSSTPPAGMVRMYGAKENPETNEITAFATTASDAGTDEAPTIHHPVSTQATLIYFFVRPAP